MITFFQISNTVLLTFLIMSSIFIIVTLSDEKNILPSFLTTILLGVLFSLSICVSKDIVLSEYSKQYSFSRNLKIEHSVKQAIDENFFKDELAIAYHVTNAIENTIFESEDYTSSCDSVNVVIKKENDNIQVSYFYNENVKKIALFSPDIKIKINHSNDMLVLKPDTAIDEQKAEEQKADINNENDKSLEKTKE